MGSKTDTPPTVVRVQDGDGRGPWKPGFSDSWAEEREDWDNLPPWIHEFGPVHLQALHGEHIGCGCLTVPQLRRWITASEYATLLGHGYKAVQVDKVRIIAQSDIQCVFARARPLSRGVRVFNLY